MDDVVYESTDVEILSGMHEFVEVCCSTKDEQYIVKQTSKNDMSKRHRVGQVDFLSKSPCGEPPLGDAQTLHEKESGMRGRPWRDVWSLWLCSDITSCCRERAAR